MKKTLYQISLSLVLMLAVKFTATAQGYSCERHIYNRSGCAWYIQVGDYPGISQQGNVWFSDATPAIPGIAADSTWANKSFWLPAGTSITIKYTSSGNNMRGTWLLMDNGGTKHPETYNGGPGRPCPYIPHSGSTGGVSLNEPANGDITIGACTWGWNSLKKSRKKGN